jgi:hypothetical protein
VSSPQINRGRFSVSGRFAITIAAFITAWGALGDSASAALVWGSPVGVGAPEAFVTHPRIAVDAAGDSVAVWYRSEGVVQSSSRAVGGSWGPEVNLSPADRSAGGPQVAMDDSGDTVAVWRASNSTDESIEAARKPAGGSWGSPVELSTGARSTYGFQVQVASNVSGDSVAIWQHSNGTNEIIESARMTANGVWSLPVAISPAGQDASEPQVAIDAAGDTEAIWRGSSGTDGSIESASEPAGSAWGVPVRLSAASGEEPQIAVDSAGDAEAVWIVDNGLKQFVQSASKIAGGIWSPAIDLSSPEEDASEPQVAVDQAGDANAIWALYDFNYLIQSATKPAESEWSSPVDLPELSDEPPEARMAMDADGNAVAIWASQNRESDYSAVEAVQKPLGGSWGALKRLSPPEIVWEPQIAAYAGGAVSAWRRTSVQVQAAVLSEARQLTLIKSGSGSGTVESSPTGINCGSKCTASFGDKTLVKLSGTPTVGSEAVVWNCPGTVNRSDECEVTMNAAEQAVATFDLPPSPPRSPTSRTTTHFKTRILYSPNHPHSPDRAGGPRYTFLFTAAVPGVNFFCRLDQESFKPCSSPKVYRALKRGRHQFKLKSVDPTERLSQVQVINFRAGRGPS